MRSPLRLALALALLPLAPTLVEAQSYAIDKGSLMIGGTAGFSSTGGDGSDDRFTQIFLNPSLQYFVTRGLAFGGDVTLQHFSQGDSESTTYGVGPAVSYFFGGNERPVYPYLSGSVQLLRGNGETSVGYSASAGAILMLMDAVGLDGSIYYHISEDDDISRNTFGLAVGIAAFVF